MLRLLFPRLTAGPARGAELFRLVTERARETHWYVAGGVPDTVDGRFAVLATIAALVIVRLERDGEAGNPLSAALTERFVGAMDAEHREMGIGDPTVGRTVRKLVASLARRVELWRDIGGGGDWDTDSLQSMFAPVDISPHGAAHAAATLRTFWHELDSSPLDTIAEGKVE